MNKLTKNLAALVVATLAGCGKVEEKLESTYSNAVIHLSTAKEVKIEPHYGTDFAFMDGIVVTTYYTDGSKKESNFFSEGSREYESLRPLLTIEEVKDGFGYNARLITSKDSK